MIYKILLILLSKPSILLLIKMMLNLHLKLSLS